MKITDNRLYTVKPFGELKIGDIFREQDGDILMKINSYSGDDRTNCVSLRDGEGYWYDINDKVVPIIDVELIIR
ncbi:MAG: hypothetical protein II449_04615 [Prevotella sp.]|nr:hypothetical protein [Prevotella sp.]MBQ2168511.1 hypothetical protein [Prevotella sp.]